MICKVTENQRLDVYKRQDQTRPVQYERGGYDSKTDIYCPMYIDYEDEEAYGDDADDWADNSWLTSLYRKNDGYMGSSAKNYQPNHLHHLHRLLHPHSHKGSKIG